MATAASRSRALALYRKLWRSARTWAGPATEKQYILEETRAQFRLNQQMTDVEEINHKIFEGESRHDIAWHYNIPYPRLHNFPTGSVTEKPLQAGAPCIEIPSAEMGSLDDTKPLAFKGDWGNLTARS